MPPHTFRDIVLFVATYEEQSFTAAAARENATQSGVSQHIRKLEEQFGVKLFERTAGSVVPTAAGDIYYRHCIDLLRASNAAADAVAGFAGGLDGRIAVGLMPTMTRLCLSGPLAAMEELHPNARIAVVEGYSADLTERVKSGELDFALVPKGEAVVGLTASEFLSTPEALVGGPDASFAAGKPVRASVLDGVNLVLPTRRNQRRRKIDDWLRDQEARPARIVELDTMMGTLDLVRRSNWVSILPILLVADAFHDDEAEFGLRVARLDPLLPPTPLACLQRSRATMPELGHIFLGFLTEACRAALAGEREAMTPRG